MAIQQDDKSLGEALRDAAANVEDIVRAEFRLAKIEMREAATKINAPVRALAVGALFGLYALGFLLLTILFALNTVLPEWLSALIVFIGTAILAAAFIAMATQRFRRLNGLFVRTTTNLREQLQWNKPQVR
jgi:uncharacterized membrane protein YqjE